MKCVKCDQEMKTVGPVEKSHNPTNGHDYNCQLYQCEGCDVWISVELPAIK